MFYVYEHIRNDTNVIFYVGKGKDYRSTSYKNRNPHWHNIVNKANGFTVNYIAKDIDEELAYLCEQERIDQLKRLGVDLVNITPGGTGVGSGKNHPMYGKAHPQKGSKRPYGNYKRGADNPRWGKPSPMRGVPKPKGKDSPLYGRPRPEGGGKPSKGVIATDKDGNKFMFVSLAEAGRFVGSDRHSIKKWCLTNKFNKGFSWEFYK